MINNEIIESYLNCKYKAHRKLNNELGVKTEFELLQDEKLSACKTKFYDCLLEEHGKNKLLEGFKFGDNGSISKVNVLIQPTLNTDTYRLSFDAIEINPEKKPNSKKTQIPLLLSSKEKFSKIEKLSIAIKCVILSKTCGVEYEFGKIIYGAGLKTVKFKIEPFLTEVKKVLNELHKISKGEFRPLIFYKNHCKICEFQEACKKELVATDSLGRLQRMREKDIKKYNSKGIFTVNQLSYTFRPRKRNRRVKTKKHPYSFPLQSLAIREQKVYLYDKVK
jgi:predicted RecB family nuclease